MWFAICLTLMQDKGIQWFEDLEKAVQAAKDSKKFLVVHLSTEW